MHPVHDDRGRWVPSRRARGRHRRARRTRMRARAAIAVSLLAFAAAAPAAETAPAASGAGTGPDGPDRIAPARYDGGCAPDPDTGTTYCGELHEAAPRLAALRSEPPVARTLGRIRARSRSGIEDAASTVGLADQNDPALVDPWRDPGATSPRGLHLREGRLVGPWNVYARAKGNNTDAPAASATRAGRALDGTLRILRAMKQGGFDDPIIAFGRQRDFRTNGRFPSQPLPSPAAYTGPVVGVVAHVGRLQPAGCAGDAYPGLRRFTAWN